MVITNYTLTAKQNISIALISDLHGQPFDQIVTSLQNRKPDIICIAGDLIHGRRPTHEGTYKMDESSHILDFLRQCAKISPVFYSLGNHERFLCEYDLGLIKDTGVTVLDNTWCTYDGIMIGGLTSHQTIRYRTFRQQIDSDLLYPHTIRSIMDTIPEPEDTWLDDFEKIDAFKILLCHHPEYWALQKPYLYNRNIQLILSGHAHGGQWRYHLNHHWHGVFAPGQGLFPKYTEGLHTSDKTNLIISRGLANTAGMILRILNPTELVYIQLKAG